MVMTMRISTVVYDDKNIVNSDNDIAITDRNHAACSRIPDICRLSYSTLNMADGLRTRHIKYSLTKVMHLHVDTTFYTNGDKVPGSWNLYITGRNKSQYWSQD